LAGDWHETLAALIADDPGLAWELLAIGEEKARPVCGDHASYLTRLVGDEFTAIMAAGVSGAGHILVL
jgi:hypothetical protein